MCLAIPAKILEINAVTDTAVVSLGGVRKSVSLALVEDTSVGDYVLVHVGYALNRISPAEAERTLALIQQAGEFDLPEFQLEPASGLYSDPDSDSDSDSNSDPNSEPKPKSDREVQS